MCNMVRSGNCVVTDMVEGAAAQMRGKRGGHESQRHLQDGDARGRELHEMLS